jgi:hypothetical protein
MEEQQRANSGFTTREEKSHPAQSKMTRWLVVGFILTLLGALTIELSVLLALGNLIGLELVSPAWLIGGLLAGAMLLWVGWLCRTLSPSEKRLSP